MAKRVESDVALTRKTPQRYPWGEWRIPAEMALWSALESVTAAARAPDPHTTAVWCRYAEADLRELWKRGQA